MAPNVPRVSDRGCSDLERDTVDGLAPRLPAAARTAVVQSFWKHYDAYAPTIFVEGGVIAVSGGFAAIGMSIGLSVLRARERDGITTYGSARWANGHEVRAAGLLGPDGVVLGRFDSHYLRHRTSERLS